MKQYDILNRDKRKEYYESKKDKINERVKI